MKPLRILVLVSEPAGARELEDRLAALGHGITAGAWQAAATRPDAVVVDVDAPGGIETAAEMAGRLELPVILLAEAGDRTAPEKAKLAGACGCMYKPLDDRELSAVLELAPAHHSARLQLKRANARLEEIWDATDHLAALDVKGMADVILAALRQLTGSHLAFYGFVNADESVMTIHAWSGEAMARCSIETKPQEFPIGEAGLWAEAVLRRSPLMVNDCAGEHAAKKGLPGGHVDLRNLLVVPVLSEGRVVAVAAAGNKPSDYTHDDVSQVTAFLHSAQIQVERTRAKEALARSQAEMKAIYDHAPVMMCVLDTERRVLYANAAFNAYTGAGEGESGSRRAGEVLGCISAAADSRGCGFGLNCGASELRKALDDTLKTGVGHREVEHRATVVRGGERREVILAAHTALIRAVGEDRLLLCLDDVTERKRAEEARREHELNLSSLFDAIHESVCLFEPDGTLVAANRTFAARLGRTVAEVVGKSIYSLISEEVAATRRVHADEVLRTGRPTSFEDEREGRWMQHTLCPVQGAGGTVNRVAVYAIDTTERRRAEEATLMMAGMLDSAPNSITVHDREGQFLYANKKTFVLHGYREDEFMGLNLRDVDVPESARLIGERIRQIAEKGEASFEVAHFRKDGTVFPLEVFAKTVTWGDRPAMLSIATDISARKLAEQALRWKHAMLARTERVANVGSWEWDVASDTVQWSDELFRIFQRAPGEGAPSFAEHPKFYHPEDMQRLRDVAEAAVNHGTPFEIELRAIRQDGETRNCLARCYAEMGAHGRAERLFGSLQDITERKQAEEALRESREVLNAVLNSIPVRVFWKDRNFVYIGCNTAFAKDAGFERPEEIIGKDDYAMGWRGQAEMYRADDRAVIESGSAKLNFEEPQTGSEGARDLLTSKLPLRDAAGAVVGVLGTYLDISERKRHEEERARLEAQLVQAQKMESIGRLAGGVAHDFNNLLTVINGYSDLLLARLKPGDPLRDSLAEIRKAGGRAAELTRSLLAFSRRQVIHPRAVDLNELIAESREMLGRMVGEDVEIVTELTRAPVTTIADPGQLHQVLMNLVVNARDAMPAGGRVTIRTSRVTLDAKGAAAIAEAAPGEYLALEVSDTGVGMSEEIKRKIFEPFFTSKADGTGLGLAMVYGIVRQAGGWITVESREGLGATFRIGLPAPAEDVGRAKAAELPASAPAGGETILVVEDQDDVRKLAVAVLKSHRYRILEARSGGEALMVAESHPGPIHLMLTDVVMPRMSGKELAERLKPLRPETKILYMSGYTADAISRLGRLTPGVEYIEKPFTPDALAQKVRGVLGERRAAGRLLVVDNEEGVRRLFRQVLAAAGYEVREAANAAQAEAALDREQCDLMLADLAMPVDSIKGIGARHPKLKLIVLAGEFAGGAADAAGELGAEATLVKPVSPPQLLEAVRKAMVVRG